MAAVVGHRLREALAQRHGVAAESLSAWLHYLGIAVDGPVKLGPLIERKSDSSAGYGFVQGWVGDDALSVLANSSDQLVRIPGTMKPHSIAVHPSPKRSVAVGWRSPVAASLRITGSVQHAHPDCGNGIAWSLELRRGRTTQRLASGTNQAGPPTPFGPLDQIVVRPGNVVALVVNPRDSDHSCDLTSLDLTLTDGSRQWNLARDLSPNILAGNPHPDGFGSADVWHFFSEPASGSAEQVIPPGSLLARWQASAQRRCRRRVRPASSPARRPRPLPARRLLGEFGIEAGARRAFGKPADQVGAFGEAEYRIPVAQTCSGQALRELDGVNQNPARNCARITRHDFRARRHSISSQTLRAHPRVDCK